jgi:DNA-binding PadR family transcriptional regulator
MVVAPRRRRVGNLLALAVLSVLVQRPMHPYEMASMLRERSKEEDMKVKWGSLYTVVQNLDKHGMVEAVGSSRNGGRPERTTYRITDEGRRELHDWAAELVAAPQHEESQFRAGLSVMGALHPREATRLLQQRRRAVEAELERRRAVQHQLSAVLPRLFLIEDEYELAMREAELRWVTAIAEELAAGTFPGMDGWAAFHDSGVVPPEIAEIAEQGRVED